jgi:hypothetical protein
VEQLAQAPEEDLWLIADSSDLRKPYAEAMPYLMQVRDLDEQLVPGYRTLNVIGLTPGLRGLLYHRLLSSQVKKHKTVTWLMDSGFDDIAVWRTIWEQQEHLVSRIYHTERKVAFQDQQGQWHEGDIAEARAELRPLARVETSMEAEAWQASAVQEATGEGEALSLSAARGLPDECTPQGARSAGDTRRLAGGGARAGGGLGAVAAGERLAGQRCPERGTHLYHVSPTLECGGQFQILENLPGLGRRAGARLASHSDVGRLGLGRRRLSL